MNTSKDLLRGDENNFNELLTALRHKEAKLSVIKELQKRLLFQRYLEEYDVNPDEELNSQSVIRRFCEQVKMSSEEELDNYLSRTGQDKQDFVDSLIYQEQISKLKKFIITSQDITDAFLKRKMRQDSVIFSLIRVENEFLAKELFFRIRDDKQDFGEICRQFSNGPEAVYGGIIGPVNIQSLNPELRSKLSSLQIGEITEPFTMDDKNFILTKLIRLDRVMLTPQIEDSIRDELFDQWVNRQLSLINI